MTPSVECRINIIIMSRISEFWVTLVNGKHTKCSTIVYHILSALCHSSGIQFSMVCFRYILILGLIMWRCTHYLALIGWLFLQLTINFPKLLFLYKYTWSDLIKTHILCLTNWLFFINIVINWKLNIIIILMY